MSPPQLTNIKNTPGQGPAVVTKNYAQLGMANVPLYQSHGVASEEYIKLSGLAAEGVRLPAAALLVADKLPADDVQKKVVTEYTKSFIERWKTNVSTFGGHAFDALMLAVEAIKKAGGADKEKVRTAIVWARTGAAAERAGERGLSEDVSVHQEVPGKRTHHAAV
jgi:branched-chain amino acid transport system substrate-binding protein